MYWRNRKVYIASIARNENLRVNDEGNRLVVLASKNRVYDFINKEKLDNPGFKKYNMIKQDAPYVMMLHDPFDFVSIYLNPTCHKNIFRYKTLLKVAKIINETNIFNIKTEDIEGKARVKK